MILFAYSINKNELVHDLLCSDPDEMYFDILKECVYKYKRTKEGTKTMCEIMDNLIQKGRAEGRDEATYETSVNIAIDMLIDGLPVDFVTKYSKLPIETVLKLQNDLILE
ncbi:MAG: hypothetical protein LUG60_01415 [Erysipelotrichaceae bacterium]|nr:hypothetical protein [Erysipelotrichaceae bacterium]